MAFRQIKTPALADQAVITAKLDVTAVSGHSAVTSLIGADELMVHDSANGALKKITSANLIGSYDTDNLSEGSTNVYFTDARVRTSVDGYVTGGTGVAVAGGAISIGQAVATTDNVTFNNVAVDGTLTTDDITSATVTTSGNMIVGGDLTVQGTTTSVNSTTVEISDNILVLNKDATTGTIDAGITVERGSDGDKSFIWDETNDRWSIGAENLYTSGSFLGSITGTVTGTVSSIANHDTDDLSEGSSNLYWTQARFNTAIAAADTDDLSEGSTNLYYTDARANAAFDTKLAAADSDDLSEGSSNLYFTNARANAVIAGASVGDLSDVDISGIAGGNTIVWDGGSSSFTTADHFDTADFNAGIAALDTDDLSEGTNLYFTTARARSSISASGSLAYNATTGVMSYTERTNSAIEALARGALSATGDLTYNSTTGAFGVVTYKDANFDARLATKDTDDLTEGSGNLYYTDARVASYLGTNSYATETYVDAQVAAVIDAAPAALDTLNELAASLNDDANFAGTMTTNLATKLALAGGTMTGNIAMGSNSITGLAAPAAGGDAANKTYVDGQVTTINNTISALDTDDVAEASNLYWTTARGITVADARIALAGVGDLADVDTTGAASGKFLKHDGSEWIVGDAAAALLELTDVTDNTFTAKADYVLQVNSGATAMELVDPAVVVWGSQNRVVINGSGVATYALGFTGSQSHAYVFVGGVIQDPTTHYTITGSSITFTSNIPTGTQAVVINPAVASVPVLQAGSVTSTQIAGTDVKAYVQGSDVAVTGATTIDTFAGGTYRSAKYIMQVDDGAGNYESREALVVHDGTTAYITEYAMVYTGADLIGDASVTMSGSDVLLQYTPTTGSATVKVIATYIDV